MGFGKHVFYFIEHKLQFLRLPLTGSIIAFAFILYLLDIQHWGTKAGKTMRKTCILIFLLAITALIFVCSSDYPYGPVALFVIFLPFYPPC